MCFKIFEILFCNRLLHLHLLKKSNSFFFLTKIEFDISVKNTIIDGFDMETIQ